MAAGLKLEYSVIKNCLWYSRTNLNISETWFSYAADAPMTWPPVLPGTLFRYRTEVAGNIAMLQVIQVFTPGMPAKFT